MALFTTYFHLRVKTSGGSVIAIFSPASTVGRDVTVGFGEAIILEREKIDFSTDNYFLGWKQRVKAIFVSSSKSITAASGYSTLEATLNAMTTGYKLEYNIIDSTAGGSNWVACELVSISKDKAQSGKNYGVKVTIELMSKSAVTNAFAT